MQGGQCFAHDQGPLFSSCHERNNLGGVECCVHEAICKIAVPWCLGNYWNEICSSWDVNIRPSLITSQMLLPLSHCTNDREVTSSIHIIYVEASVKFQLILMCSSSVVDHQKIQYNWTGWLSWHLSTYKCAHTHTHTHTHTCTHTHTLQVVQQPVVLSPAGHHWDVGNWNTKRTTKTWKGNYLLIGMGLYTFPQNVVL